MYPAYITIGNVPKAIRRKISSDAHRLFAYLPTVSFNTADLTEKDKKLAKSRLYHHAMRLIFESLKQPGRDGTEMISGDGSVRHGHPILASSALDYPEQCLVSGVRYGECPICTCPADHLEDYGDCPLRTQAQTLSVLKTAEKMRTWGAIDDYLKSLLRSSDPSGKTSHSPTSISLSPPMFYTSSPKEW